MFKTFQDLNEISIENIEESVLQAGEVVLVDTPLVQGPGNKTPPTCLDCLSPWKEADGATCTLCKWPVCGETCQSGLWHSIECSTLSRLKTVPVFSSGINNKGIDQNISVYKINEYCRFWEKYKQKSDVVMSDLAV